MAHVKVLWQMQKFMCYCTVFVFTFNLRAISKYKPPGVIFEGAYFRNFTVIYEKTKGKFPGEKHHVR